MNALTMKNISIESKNCFLSFGLFILYQKQQPRLYGNNMSIIDERILTFDIFQPVSYWGDIPQRRIPGLSGKYIYFN
jgi:hypothetical protein